MYNSFDITVRELAGGVWFFMSAFLTAAFIGYLVRNWWHEGFDATARVAVALDIFCLGSTIRGFLTWQQFRYAGNGWDPSPWIATWPWFFLSVALNITGAAICIWLIAPRALRYVYTTGAVVFGVGIPLLMWVLA